MNVDVYWDIYSQEGNINQTKADIDRCSELVRLHPGYYQKHFFFQLWQKTKIPRNPFTIDFDKLQDVLELWESVTDSFYQLLRLY